MAGAEVREGQPGGRGRIDAQVISVAASPLNVGRSTL